MHDTTLSRVARRLTAIETQLESLRNDVLYTDNEQRSAALERPPVAPSTTVADATRVVASEGRTAPTEPTPAIRSQPHRHPLPMALPAARSLESIVSGRGLAVIGALLMLFGCVYFVDLSFTRNWIGPLERILLGFATGTALMAVAPRFLRGAYRIAAEAATGLGAGVIYLCAWASIAVFPQLHISSAVAFAVTIAATCALFAIAERARSQAIGIIGLAGAYLTPVLFATGVLERPSLAAYLLVVTAGGLALARRRSFLGLELITVVATLAYSFTFWPSADRFIFWPTANLEWTQTDAAIVASLFFALFAVASTTRPVIRVSALPLRIAPLVATTCFFTIALECIWRSNQTLLGEVLFGLAALFLIVPAAFKRLPAELVPVYRVLGVLAFNLGLRSLLHGAILLDVFVAQAALLMSLGARTASVRIVRTGLAIFATTAAWLVVMAATAAPAQALETPLAFAFLAWTSAAIAARRAVPANLRSTFSVVAHSIVFIGLTRAVLDATGGPYWTSAMPNVTQCTLSIVWALFATALFAYGVTRRADVQRWEALAIFAVTIAKVCTFDLASLDLAYRVLAFIGTGVLVFLSSVWYARSMRGRAGEGAAQTPA